jgi:oligopeptidase B
VTPPSAPRRPQTTELHGRTRVDDYAWLRDKEDPATLAYIEAENSYCDQWFEALAPLRRDIFNEVKARTQEDDSSVPTRKGQWMYSSRTVEGLSYAIHERRPVGKLVASNVASDVPSDAAMQLLLDQNQLAEGHEFHELGILDVSPSGELLAYATDNDGSENYSLRIRDIASGIDRDLTIEPVSPGSAWSSDDQSIFTLRPDDQMRPHQVWCHGLDGTASLVLEEPDESFYLSLDQSRSGDWVIITAQSKTTTEVWVIPANAPATPPRSIAGRVHGRELDVDHWGDSFVVLTNTNGATDFCVMTAPLDTTSESTWTTLIDHQPSCRITEIAAFADYLIVVQWLDGLEQVRVVQRNGHSEVLHFDEEVYSVGLGANPEYDTDTVRLGYTSMVTPPTVMDHHLPTGERTIRKQQPVLGGFDPSHYVTTRHWATAPDGVKVPFDVMHRRDASGPMPTLLYAYGAYEISVPPYFSIFRLSLLDRGCAFVLAHPRGGGELGRNWYLDGKLANKQHTFDDIAAIATTLIDMNITAADRLCLRGGSAGGLLVGAVVNQHPELFASAIAEVPFVDVINTMLDEALPLTVIEWEEWGNPKVAVECGWMEHYSPYDNIVAQQYPALYVSAGWNDPRVSYHEPAKWVAKLRAVSQSTNPILLRTELGAGHGGPTGRYAEWEDEAKTLAFMLHSTGAV